MSQRLYDFSLTFMISCDIIARFDGNARRFLKRKIQILVGLLIGIGLLWLLFRGADWSAVWAEIRGASPGWLALSTGLIVLSFFTRIQRWTYIVRAAKPVSFRHMFSATQIGFLANFTLPGRIGEVVRALVLGRLAKLPFSKCFAMVALDRVTDLIGLLAVILVTVLAFSPRDITIPEKTLGWQVTFTTEQARWFELSAVLFLVASVSALVLLYLKRDLVLWITDACVGILSKRLAARLHAFGEHFADGLHIFRSGTEMAKSIGFSLLTWAVCIGVLLTSLWAFHIDCPWYTVFLIEMTLAIFISAPGAPGFIGQFQAGIVVGLIMAAPDVDDSKAKALSLVIYVLNLVPVIAVGMFCLFWERFGFLELSRESSRVKTEIKAETRPSEAD
jgi:hypothetical protein